MNRRDISGKFKFPIIAIMSVIILCAANIVANQLDSGLNDKEDGLDERSYPCSLLKNDPNPFKSETSIAFTVPEKMHVLIEIHNAAGRKVGVAADDFFAPGKHSVEWNARSFNGEDLSEGIYFYVMTAGNHKETRKMALIR